MVKPSRRYLQLFGSVLLGVGITCLGTLVWNLPDNSGVATGLVVFLMGPGMMTSTLLNGIDDINLRTVQIANAVIYSAIGYVALRFIEFLKTEDRKRS